MRFYTIILASFFICKPGFGEARNLSEPWDAEVGVKGNLSFSDNQDVIGQQQGTTTTLGYDMRSGLFFAEGAHEADFTFTLVGGFSKNPELSEFFKTQDKFRLETLYRYLLSKEPRFGLFVKAGAEAPLFKGKDVRSSASNYLLTRRDGTTSTTNGVKSYDLTDSFKPLIFDQSIGVFYDPFSYDYATLELTLGAGAKEVFAENQLYIENDDATAAVDVFELRSYQQVGAEAGSKLHGKLKDEVIDYELKANLFLPLVKGNVSGDKRDSIDLLVQKYAAQVNVSLMDWLGVSYVFSATKEPQLLDEFQVSNAIFVNLAHWFYKRRATEEE